LICTDGFFTAAPSLERLRRTMSMIPQEAGTLRDNLDRFAERTEVQCATALAHAVGGGSGSTLFVGERQLLPIARALLRDFKVVCMDEPTSHVDAATDARVQRFVSQDFPHTLIVIVHRLHMAVGFVQLAVMADGAVQMARTPAALLATAGPLGERAAALGPDAATKLRALVAKGTFKRKPHNVHNYDSRLITKKVTVLHIPRPKHSPSSKSKHINT
jgi:ABC-type multidrug transport system fused ATPase/permease subunit